MSASSSAKRIAISPAAWDKKLNEVDVSKNDLNRLVMDYLVVEGYKEAAENFAREAGMSPQADYESIHNRMTIRNAIQRGDIEEAIERVNDLNPEILDNDPSLYFHLQQQRLIELIREKKIDEALLFAQEELAPRGEEHPEFLSELERTMTLLAYDVDLGALEESMSKNGAGAEEPAAEEGTPAFIAALLHPAHRQSTAAQVNAAILTSQSHGPTPKLPNLLRMLAWGESLLKEKAEFSTLEMQIRQTQPQPPKTESGPASSSSSNNNNDVAMVI